MCHYCFAGWRLSSSVTLPAGRQAGRRARGRSGGRHCTAGQYGYVPFKATPCYTSAVDFIKLVMPAGLWAHVNISFVVSYFSIQTLKAFRFRGLRLLAHDPGLCLWTPLGSAWLPLMASCSPCQTTVPPLKTSRQFEHWSLSLRFLHAALRDRLHVARIQ